MLDIDFIKGKLAATFIDDIYYAEEIDSTNVYAKNTLSTGSLLVLADFQKHGKGRFERTWASEKGSNLTFSIKNKFTISSVEISNINFFFTYKVYTVIKKYLFLNEIQDEGLTVKWPNDILYNSKKICGILVESNLNTGEFIIGIGINLNQKSFPAELNADSLSNITNSEIDTSGFLTEIILSINEDINLLKSPVSSVLYENWKSASKIEGKPAKFTYGNNSVKDCKIISLKDDGGIELLIDGEKRVFYSGEIKIIEIES